MPPFPTPSNATTQGESRGPWKNQPFVRWVIWGLVGTVVVGSVGAYFLRPGRTKSETAPEATRPAPSESREPGPELVRLSPDQQKAIGMETQAAVEGSMHQVLKAPGQVTPDETRYAFITPRAPGPVRSVSAHVGQDVKAGELLATIDSPEVAQARLELVTRLQALEIAQANADWQERIFQATTDLIAMLEQGLSPEEIQEKLGERVVGENLERLMTAYAKDRLAAASYRRSADLRKENAVSVEIYQQHQAEHEAASATYDALMDSLEFGAKLEHSKAVQQRKQAETAVRVAREYLRVLGVPSDGSEPAARVGSADETQPGGPSTAPISAYSISAPFDGTVLDRELIVPGVYVDTTHRIFTIADLSKVWIQVKVQESEFGELASLRGGKLSFTSPAYPGQVFEGRVLYTGDLVEEKTRAIQLLAEADNPGRLLKPGMFVQVEVIGIAAKKAVFIPRSALLSEEAGRYVYVRTGPDRFERRDVELGEREGDRVGVTRGLKPGEEVVTRGAFKLKAAAEAEGDEEAPQAVARAV